MVSGGGTGGTLLGLAVSGPLALKLTAGCSEVEHDFKKFTLDASIISMLVTGMLKLYSN